MPRIEDSSQATNYVELDWYDESEIVQVNPRDQQRFEIQKDRAIEILRAEKNAERFQKQLMLLVNTILHWAIPLQDKLSKAILTFQDGALALVVVQKVGKYDESLQDNLLDLDLNIANDVDFDLVKVKTILLPKVSDEALSSFLDKRLLFLIYDGKRERSHSVSQS